MTMYDICERCGNEIAWDPDFADYTTGRIAIMSLEQQHGVFIKSSNFVESWCKGCINQFAEYDKKTQTYSAL